MDDVADTLADIEVVAVTVLETENDCEAAGVDDIVLLCVSNTDNDKPALPVFVLDWLGVNVTDSEGCA